MIYPSLWNTIRQDIRRIVIRPIGYPIKVYSDSYEPIVIYSIADASFKNLREQLSDILTISDPQKIWLRKKDLVGRRGTGANYSDNDIVHVSLFAPTGTGLWMEILDN
jgi:hypothetical protein